ncbi:hypothetical protein RvY_06335, partial [Ramazzottius varieornatus]
LDKRLPTMSAYQSRANTFFLFFHKYLHVAFTFFQVFGCLFNGTVGLDVQIITVINSDNPFYGYSASAPVFEVAFVKMQELYPRAFANVSRYALYSTSKVTCPDGALTVPLISHNISEILAGSPSTGLSVLFCPGCSLEITVLGDFAREWNVPLFSSLGSDPSLADKRRYPTVTTFPTVDHRSISIAVQLFLRKHRWRIVSILCDSLSQFGALSTFYVISCNTIKRKLDAAVGDFQLHLVPFDSKSNIANDYFTVLRKVQQLSRGQYFFLQIKIFSCGNVCPSNLLKSFFPVTVVIIVTLPAFVRSIMVGQATSRTK